VTPLSLTLLGSPTLTVGGASATASVGAKPLALLAYLAVEPGPHSREHLAALLWGEHTDAAARASLRQAVMQLREVVGDALHVTRDAVDLSGPLECDVQAFLTAVTSDPPAAAAFDVPRFLAGLAVRHSPAFDDWVSAKRDELLRQYRAALAAKAKDAMGKWQWRDAAAEAARWLAWEPLADEAARLLVEALYLAGDRVGALARFGEFRDRLRAETGSPPGKALAQLARKIEQDQGLRPTRPITDEWYTRAPKFECGLVGRVAELEQLRKAWSGVQRGNGRIALIEGEAGVGKSRWSWAMSATCCGRAFRHWLRPRRS